MSRMRIGECLSRIVPLTSQDVEEILNEQRLTHHQFGQIALAWGLCRPQDLWQAWCEQLGDGAEHIDLQKIGIDAQATAALRRDLALQYRVMPIRHFADELVLAAGDARSDLAVAELPRQVRQNLTFVLADERQVLHAIETYYPPPSVPA